MSLTDFTVYNSSGSIIRTGSCPEDMCDAQADAGAGEYVIYTKTDIKTDLIDVSDPEQPTVIAKQSNSMSINKTTFTSDGVDYVRVNAVPTDAKVWISMDASLGITGVIDYPVTDGWVEVTTTQAGDYTITIDNGILLPYEVIIHAI